MAVAARAVVEAIFLSAVRRVIGVVTEVENTGEVAADQTGVEEGDGEGVAFREGVRS